ncbi:MAG: hypothetical protein ABIG44_11260 [Planctomycetota bacterium]
MPQPALDALLLQVRDMDWEPSCTQVLDIARRNGLGGIAIVSVQYNERRELVPAPITVMFEPTRLRETDRALRQLTSLVTSEGDGKPIKLKPSLLGRNILRLGVPFSLILLIQVAHYSEATGNMIYLAVAFIGWLLFQLWRLISRKTWIIAPGVVCVDGCWPNEDSVDSQLRTPRNSLLRVESKWNGWYTELTDGENSWYTKLTTMEYMMLLAAWQSPIVVPHGKSAEGTI